MMGALAAATERVARSRTRNTRWAGVRDAERVLGDTRSGPVSEGRATHGRSVREGRGGGRAGVEG